MVRKVDIDRRARALGQDLATEALKRHEAREQRRRQKLRTLESTHTIWSIRAATVPVVSVAQIVEDAANLPSAIRNSRGTLIAEGDSWFDYPGRDILDVLEEECFEIVSRAHRGDEVEEMAYGGHQIDEVLHALESCASKGEKIVGILLSGGGNDIAGDGFKMLLNHRRSPLNGQGVVNVTVLEGLLQGLRASFATIFHSLNTVSQAIAGSRINIFVHGYDYPVPDGRGFLGGFGALPGPWLAPGFLAKGYSDGDMSERLTALRVVIDGFNEMLEDLANQSQFGNVHYINLRHTLSSDQDYRNDWANELHPTQDGFDKVANAFLAVIAASL